MIQYEKENYNLIDKKWTTSKPYLEIINSSQNMKELTGSPFLLKMFVEVIPFMKQDYNFGILDIYK